SWGADGDRNLNLDLAGSIYTAFRIEVTSVTLPGSLFMRVATAADSEHPSFGRSFAAFDGNGIVGPGSHLLRFTDFVPDDGPGADFPNIDSTGLEYQPTGAGGIELASFQLFPASLPAAGAPSLSPVGLALLVCALAAAGVVRVRARPQPASASRS